MADDVQVLPRAQQLYSLRLRFLRSIIGGTYPLHESDHDYDGVCICNGHSNGLWVRKVCDRDLR
jgi:hypothetical protein